jgi:hypothetical protein
MEEKDQKDFLKEFENAEGGKKLDMWDFALSQQVLWENIIIDLQKIANEQGVDKKLDKMMQEEIKKAEQEMKK